MARPERRPQRKLPFLLRTAREFAGRTTVHGAAYLADPSLCLTSRLLWAAIVLLSAPWPATSPAPPTATGAPTS
jgi:hypothetical protein